MVSGSFYKVEIEELGEFRFLFENKAKHNQGNYFLEAYWSPKNYGIVDHIVGYDVKDINIEMYKIINDMSYFIDGARVSCICHMEDNTDTEGVYEGILASCFDYDENDFKEIYANAVNNKLN